MGIKFDILCDTVLVEDSELSRFFTGAEPIRKIHQELGLEAGEQPSIQSTRNRHVIWDALRTGDAMFVVIHKPLNIQQARKRLSDSFLTNSDDAATDKPRSQNEIRQGINNALRVAPEGETADADAVARLKKMFFGRAQNFQPGSGYANARGGIANAIREVYGAKSDEKIAELNTFITNVTEADRFMIKRVATGGGSMATNRKPESRRFPIATRPGERVTGQQYNVWMFSGDKFISKQTLKKNVTHIFRPEKGGLSELKGWADRDYYLVRNKAFQVQNATTTAPGEISLRINHVGISAFTKNTITKYQPVVTKKIGENQAAMKQWYLDQTDDPNSTEVEAEEAQRDYRRMLGVMHGKIEFDYNQMFSDYLTKTNVMEDIRATDKEGGAAGPGITISKTMEKTQDPLGDGSDGSGGAPGGMPSQDELKQELNQYLTAVIGSQSMSPLTLHFDTESTYSAFQRNYITFMLRRLIKSSGHGAVEDILMDMFN